ncbi:MAG: hypothetical protein IJ628_02200 [Bacteroidaceae bacterium]|nr:hypothetical protein [Bacteroidaceae bacterium]
MITKHYKVAGHTFAISGSDELFEQMENYEPFECEGIEPLFTLTEDSGAVPEYMEVYRIEGDRTTVIHGHTASGNDVFEFARRRTKSEGCLICSKDHREGRLILKRRIYKTVFNDALMMLFALATAGKDTLLLHAVAVSQERKGYLFLGPSGEGKSTHARLWLEHVEGTELVNDDFPVVRDGVVYGSPWGWGIPCYRNVCYPIGGIVCLNQAPYNKIQRLNGVEAYMNLYPSVLGNGLGIVEEIDEGWHQTENALASTIPMWHLDCLPDEAAARLCHDTITNQGI